MLSRDLSGARPGAAIPSGKLPSELLRRLLAQLPTSDDVVIAPGIGQDVAVVEACGIRLALKSDPITFATDRLGWYAVHVNANDLATVGAEPKWFLATLLLPAGQADEALVERIINDMVEAASDIGVVLVGGHTEVTSSVRKPVVAGAIVGIISGDLLKPSGLRPGDRILLTKGMAIEATAIVARELPDRLRVAGLTAEEIDEAAAYLTQPGISVLRDSRIARGAGEVHAMHDPTEGGVVTALDELAEAAHVALEVEADALMETASPLTEKVCRAVGIDPRGAISSGALLVGVEERSVKPIQSALREAGIAAYCIGTVVEGPVGCRAIGSGGGTWPRFARDEIARLFERT